MPDLSVTIVPAHDDRDVRVESQFKHLHTSGFLRGATAIDQWFLLVGDAWRETRLPMNIIMRDYLATMLHRFTTRTDLLEQLSLFQFVPHLLGNRPIDSVSVQDVADMSLQYVAFFPERSGYRHEPRSLEYSARIGVSLYQELSTEAKGKDDWFSHAYRQMAHAFGQATMVLRAISPNFAHKQRITDAVKSNGELLPSDIEVAKIRNAYQTFAGMNFVPEGGSISRNN